MRKLLLLLFLLIFTNSCQAQTTQLQLNWKDFESKEIGIKTTVPCELTKHFKSFQDQPRPIHAYDFDCEVEGMKFLISFKNHLDDFDENTIKRVFEVNENNLKIIFGKVDKFSSKKDFQTNGFTSRFYEVYPSSGGKVFNLIVVNEKGIYEAMFGVTSENAAKLRNSKVDFDEIGKKFIDSFRIWEK